MPSADSIDIAKDMVTRTHTHMYVCMYVYIHTYSHAHVTTQVPEKKDIFVPSVDSIDIAKDMVTRLEQEQKLANEKLQKAQTQVCMHVCTSICMY